eukprot:g6026.t1
MTEGVDFVQQENRDGVRFSWNVWPTSRIEATRVVVPVGCMYTPLKKVEGLPPPLKYQPVRCKRTGSVLNPYCQIDFHSKLWTCPFSMQRNHFPQHYAAAISETNLPAELIPQYSTIEYELPGRVAGPPVFLYVVDTCIPEEEIKELKDSLLQSLSLLPETALVGLITFGRMVHVHEVGSQSGLPKAYVFRGHKDYDGPAVQELLRLVPKGRRQALKGGITPPEATARFLQPVGDCEFVLETILEDLQVDPWTRKTGQRASRCTGVALAIATGLLETCVPRRGSRIMLFSGGPPTTGPGAVSSLKLTEQMRSHTDLEQNNANASLHKGATKFYDGLAKRCVKNSHVVDMFCCHLDQVGLLEMISMPEKTGGAVVLGDSFGQSVFKNSFKRMFTKDANGDLDMAFAGTLEVLTSREFKVCGAIGTCSSLGKTAPYVSENEIGEGGTYAWSIAGINPRTTIGLYFEVTNPHTNPINQGQRPHIQLVTTYQHSSGAYRMRVTTVVLQWNHDPTNTLAIRSGFDQECAVSLMSRIAAYRTKSEQTSEILRWLDRSLIRLCAKFADYTKDQPESFQLGIEFSLYPQFFFHLRRSQFLQTFNCSPDETAFYRNKLIGETVANTLVMVQPALLNYSFQAPPHPVLLDLDSVKHDNILMLDTFFHVVIHHGATMAAWRDQGFHLRPDHANFKALLQAPIDDAQLIMADRFPVPRFIVCDQHKSQARFLLAKLNPSKPQYAGDGSEQQLFTDDVSLRVFMEHLVKLAVQSS